MTTNTTRRTGFMGWSQTVGRVVEFKGRFYRHCDGRGIERPADFERMCSLRGETLADCIDEATELASDPPGVE